MNIRSYSYPELDSGALTANLNKYGGIHLRDVLPIPLVRRAMEGLLGLFEDADRLERLPYDPETRLGYTPPGIEGLQNKKDAITTRHLFDYHPKLEIGDGAIKSLYEAARDVGLDVLARIDRACGTQVSTMTSIEADHQLSAAEYLPVDTTPEDILFPEHRDFGFLTVFVGSGSPGLQAKVKGFYEDVVLPYGDAFIGVGTPLLQYCPSFKALWHRVVGGGGRRLSSFLFLEPHADVILPSGERYGDSLTRILASVRKD